MKTGAREKGGKSALAINPADVAIFIRCQLEMNYYFCLRLHSSLLPPPDFLNVFMHMFLRTPTKNSIKLKEKDSPQFSHPFNSGGGKV
jgi:hypothetical protein